MSDHSDATIVKAAAAALLAEHHEAMANSVAKTLAEIHLKVGKVVGEDLDMKDRPDVGALLTGTLTCREWRFIRLAIEQSRELIRPKGGS
jgi:hypothetical protein